MIKIKTVAVHCPVCKTKNGILIDKDTGIVTDNIKCYKCNCIANKKMWGVIV